ncbi:MAG: 5-formyltetrahydrofolate cyclo-ligase [SAR324 cluster bacterium]|nr:5-formyltetrahydrofolate cyclo-ligase [SAR324 cluster bacterium]
MLLLNKTEIRKTLLKQRRGLSASKKKQYELQMLNSLWTWDVFKEASIIHIFLSKADEPETSQIIELAWKSGKQIGVPCVLPDTLELFHSQLNSFEDLRPSALGVLEPSPEKRISLTPESFDLVIVPGVAFDRQGGRLGYGKGYYDRFLDQSLAFRLALAFDFQLLETVPTEAHDVPMDGILTENGIYFCGDSQT